MKQQSRFDSGEEHEHNAGHETRQENVREFAGAEELLRHDAAHTRVPPGIADRLRLSARELPAPKQSWWKRWFGGGS